MVAIKDMEMPNECAYCVFCTNNWKCILLNKRANNIVGYHAKLSDCPLVEIEERKGKWIKTGGSFRCSECMNMPEFKDIRTLNYCPNCGAEMVGDETKYDCAKCKHDGFICDECENGSKYEEMRGSENEVN